MKRYTLDERKHAIDMLRSIGTTQTSERLGIPLTTLQRWRRDADLQALIEHSNIDIQSPGHDKEKPGRIGYAENTQHGVLLAQVPSLLVDETLPKECEVDDPNFQKTRTDPCNCRALEEAFSTIEALQLENARLLDLTRKLRTALKDLAEVF